jgi:hypothetical protein
VNPEEEARAVPTPPPWSHRPLAPGGPAAGVVFPSPAPPMAAPTAGYPWPGLPPGADAPTAHVHTFARPRPPAGWAPTPSLPAAPVRGRVPEPGRAPDLKAFR